METRHESETPNESNQMIIEVNRYLSDGDTTLSKISIDGEFQCNGLEDEYREVKLKGETRIPSGEYKITLRTVGGFHGRYLSAYGEDFHKGMLWVRNVPGFEYILIHKGNTEKNTMGCLLLGKADEKAMAVWSSGDAYKAFYPKVRDALLAGKEVYIRYLDNDS